MAQKDFVRDEMVNKEINEICADYNLNFGMVRKWRQD